MQRPGCNPWGPCPGPRVRALLPLLLCLGLAPGTVKALTTTAAATTTAEAAATTPTTTAALARVTTTANWTAKTTTTPGATTTHTATATVTTTATTITTTVTTTLEVTVTTSVTATTTAVSTTTLTTTTPFQTVGSLGEVTCLDEVVDTVLYSHGSETLRLAVSGAVVDCTAYSRGLLQLALDFGREEAAYNLARAYVPRSWQFYIRNGTGATTLLMAADRGYTGVVEEMVANKGIDPLVAEAGGNTALHLAARWTSTAVKLLQIASDPVSLQLAVNTAGDQAIHIALKHGSVATATQMVNSALLRVGVEFAARVATAKDGAGSRPVHLTGNEPLLQLLVRRGARLDALDGNGAFPFHTVAFYAGAASNGALALAAAAADAAGGGGPNVRDSRGRTPLHYAATGGSVENIQWLIGRGADSGLVDNAGILPLSLGLQRNHGHIVDAFSSGRSPPLLAVVSLGSVEMLRFMVLNQSLSVGVTDPLTGRSAIFEAAERGRNEMVGFLLDNGVDVNSMDRSGLSLLSAVILAGQPRTVELLLNHSVNVGQVLQNGSTALHLAASLGALPEANMLLAVGANVKAVDYYGQTPMHLVSSAAVADRLMQYGATPMRTTRGLQPLHSAALAGRTEVMETILKWRHGGVDERADNGDTPLHLAAASGVGSAALVLLRWCADSQARNNAGHLPHQLAFDRAVARAIRDATLRGDRCQCDCGPYDPGPLYLTFNWRGGCKASTKCQLDGFAGATEQLECTPQVVAQDAMNVTSQWTPASPSLSCGAVASVSKAASEAGQACLLGFLAVLATLWNS